MEDNKALIARCNSAFVAVVGLGEECACCTFAPRFLACRPRPRCVVDGVLDAAWEGYVEGWSGDAGVIELMPSFRGKEADGPPRSIEIGLRDVVDRAGRRRRRRRGAERRRHYWMPVRWRASCRSWQACRATIRPSRTVNTS